MPAQIRMSDGLLTQSAVRLITTTTIDDLNAAMVAQP
jgi:hypothetical protein